MNPIGLSLEFLNLSSSSLSFCGDRVIVGGVKVVVGVTLPKLCFEGIVVKCILPRWSV